MIEESGVILDGFSIIVLFVRIVGIIFNVIWFIG